MVMKNLQCSYKLKMNLQAKKFKVVFLLTPGKTHSLVPIIPPPLLGRDKLLIPRSYKNLFQKVLL